MFDEWHFDMVKLDFLYAAAIEPRNNKTRGQLMCEAMDFLRECCGDKSFSDAACLSALRSEWWTLAV